MVAREDGKGITINEGTKIGDVPYFVDGAILKVNTKNPKKQKVVSGLKASELQHTEEKTKSDLPPIPKCNHGPTGRCINCTSVDLKDKVVTAKMLCQHGPNAKCIHCLGN